VEVNAFTEEVLVERLHGDRGSFPTALSSRNQRNFYDPEEVGRDDWIRTSDPLTPSQVRYQAAPHPDKAIVLIVSLKADTTFPRPTVRLEPDTTY
jgi:hypothetical protein